MLTFCIELKRQGRIVRFSKKILVYRVHREKIPCTSEFVARKSRRKRSSWLETTLGTI